MSLIFMAAGLGIAGSTVGIRLARRWRNSSWQGVPAWVFWSLTVLAILSLLALAAIDKLLAQMHGAGLADQGIADLTAPFAVLRSSSIVPDLLERWNEWYQGARTD